MHNSELLKVDNLKKYYPMRRKLRSLLGKKQPSYFRTVDGVSFILAKGEILGLVGQSGCGKSTMSRTILRLTKATGGRVYFKGTEISSLKMHLYKKNFRPKMQMIFQDPFGALNPRRTIANTLRQTIRIHKLAENREAESALIEKNLEEVELKPVERFQNKYPGMLSGGQLQRVCIARVLMMRPSLIIADEVVSMLDVSVRIGILDLLKNMRKYFGISFIYITHDLVSARYICDRIAIMYLGKIVELGSVDQIINNPLHPYTKALISAVPELDSKKKNWGVPIKGELTSAWDNPGTGCVFAKRCLYSNAKCLAQNTPDLITLADSHQVACHRHPNS